VKNGDLLTEVKADGRMMAVETRRAAKDRVELLVVSSIHFTEKIC